MNLGSSLIAIKCKMGRWSTARFSAVYIEFWRLVGAGMLRICEVSWLTHRALCEILADYFENAAVQTERSFDHG